MPPAIAVVCNRFSDGNRGVPALAAYAAELPGVLVCAPSSVDELAQCLRNFARHPLAALAVDGGDGTLREVLSLMPETFGAQCPPVALLPSGKTNLAARDVGTFGGGRAGLARLVASARSDWQGARWTERPALEVTWHDTPERTVRGLLFGAGAFAYATRMAGQWAHDHGFRYRSAVAIGVMRVLWEVFRGKAALADPAVTRTVDNQGMTPSQPCFLLLATTARKLMLGLWPFPPVTVENGLNWLAIEHPPRGLLSALWRAWRGRLLPQGGPSLSGGRNRQMHLRLTGPFVIDGEVYQAGPAGITVRAGHVFRFVSG